MGVARRQVANLGHAVAIAKLGPSGSVTVNLEPARTNRAKPTGADQIKGVKLLRLRAAAGTVHRPEPAERLVGACGAIA